MYRLFVILCNRKTNLHKGNVQLSFLLTYLFNGFKQAIFPLCGNLVFEKCFDKITPDGMYAYHFKCHCLIII